MPFLQGKISFQRFMTPKPPPAFDQEHLDRLNDRAAGRQRVAAADGVETGWTAGGHLLDTTFDLAKNVLPAATLDGALHFGLRVDVDKLPADRLKAFTAIELKALAENNPSRFPSARQKREAKDLARERLEGEAKDGRYKKLKASEALWLLGAGPTIVPPGILFTGAAGAVDRFCSLFEQTFQQSLAPWGADAAAKNLPDYVSPRDVAEQMQAHAEIAPTAFVQAGPDAPTTSAPPTNYAWVADESSKAYLGNEFLLWLWYYSEVESDTLTLPDRSECTFMFARTLTLACPRGQTGTDVFTHEGPTRLPEARRAVRSGKRPRRAGLTLVRNDEQYELTLQAETFAVTGAKLPPVDKEFTDPRARAEDRLRKLLGLLETLDLLYAAFLEARLQPTLWREETEAVARWLARKEGVS